MFFYQGRRKTQWSNWQARALLLSLEKKLFQVENILKTLFNSRKNCSDTLSQPRLFFFLSWLSSSLSSSFWSSRLEEEQNQTNIFNNFFSNGLTSWLWRRIISNSCATFQKFYWQSLFQYLMGFITRLPCGSMIWVSL